MIITDITTIEIPENGNLNDLIGVKVIDDDFQFKYSSYKLTIKSDISQAEQQIQLFQDEGSQTTDISFKVVPNTDDPVFDYEQRFQAVFELVATAKFNESISVSQG